MSSSELFEFFLRLTVQGDGINIGFQFPDRITDQGVLQSVPRFCFPEGTAELATIKEDKVESFSFVSTLSDGNKRFGYCRRFFKQGRAPECYCLLSFSASFSLFSQLLDIVELKFVEGDKSVFTFLHSVLAQPFPDPGQTIQAQTFSTVVRENGVVDYLPETFRLTRSNDDYEYLEYVTYEKLFRTLDVDKIMLIFECLLNERRILLVASNLTTLTQCMDAVANMAYPFAWQYVFIPILPKTMLSFLGAPMPFLMGILSACLDDALKEPMEEGVLIVDVDNNEILQGPEDLPDMMPPNATEKLRKSLKKAVSSEKRNMEFSIDVAHAFLKFWVLIFGVYSKYLEPVGGPPPAAITVAGSSGASTDSRTANSPADGHAHSPGPARNYSFNFDRFSKSKSSEIKKFLGVFHQNQLCQYFIQEREEWCKKGLLGYCIILRAQTARKRDSVAAVKAKILTKVTSKVNKFVDAWNQGYATTVVAAHAKRQAQLTNRKSLTLIEAAPAGKKDSTEDSTSEAMDSAATSSPREGAAGSSGMKDTTTDSTDDTSRPADASTPPTRAKNFNNTGAFATSHKIDRPVLPPKPKAGQRATKGDDSVSVSTSSSSKPPLATKINPQTPTKSANLMSASSDAVASTQPSSANTSTAAISSASGSPSSAPGSNPGSGQFSSRYTFKPTPLIEGSYEKQIWKLCNVEALSDIQLQSIDGHSYWAYSPLLFQRLPEVAKMPRDGDQCLHLPLTDDAVEALLQWVFSDEIEIESAECALELLTIFANTESVRSVSSSSHLRYSIAMSSIARLSTNNVLHYLKIFSAPNVNLDDPYLAAVYAASKLFISKFTAYEMNPIFRRQLSSVSYTALTAILLLRTSSSAKLEAEGIVDRIKNRAFSEASKYKYLTQDMGKLLEQGTNTDLTLTFPASKQTEQDSTSKADSRSAPGSEEVQFKVHSKILATRSPHFSKMLALNAGESTVKVLNVQASHFKLLLPYIYTGRVENIKLDRTSVCELVQAAHVLDLDTTCFRDALYSCLSESFTSSSVFDFLDSAAPKEGVMQHPAERSVLVGAAAYYLARSSTVFYRPERLKTLDPDVWECIFKYAFAASSSTEVVSLDAKSVLSPRREERSGSADKDTEKDKTSKDKDKEKDKTSSTKDRAEDKERADRKDSKDKDGDKDKKSKTEKADKSDSSSSTSAAKKKKTPS